MLWNEPWEGLSISGWGADMLRYRRIYKHMGRAAERAREDARVDVLVGGGDSSSNSWDKLFPDGSEEFMPYFDFCSIHYQGMSAPVLHPEWRSREVGNGRVLIWDTESWVANTDDGTIVVSGDIGTAVNQGNRRTEQPAVFPPPRLRADLREDLALHGHRHAAKRAAVR